MRFREVLREPAGKAGEGGEEWKFFRPEWAVQPWTVDTMVEVLADPNSTLANLAESMNKSLVVQTSARDITTSLKNFCAKRYGDGGYEVWRTSLLLDMQQQKEWLAEPENRTRALRAVREKSTREAILERYQTLAAG